jgi:hypothetical chaperone protein
MSYYCGIDFGTSNSVVTVLHDGSGDRVQTPLVIREPSLMFFPEDAETTSRRYCGRRALEEYVARGMRGRFFQSVKSILPDPGFTRTRVNGKPFSAEDLVAVMLRFLRREAERLVGGPVTRAVIGRPARFSDDPSRETLAQERLERAAAQAGIEEAVYELEPVAGAYAYASRGARGSAGTVFISDHGGGTSDFTLMRLGADEAGRPRASEILATHGLRAGGDDFDGAIMWNRLVGQFGYDTHYESFGKMLPVPVHIFHIISRWDRIHFLKTLSYREELRTYLRSSDNPIAIRRLIKLVEEDLGYFIFQAIERAKIELSSRQRSAVRYENGKLRIDEGITREQFEGYICEHVTRIAAGVDATLGGAGVDGSSVDAVFMTGGSAKVPAVRNVLSDRFGEAQIVDDADQFQSVSLGLALAARDRRLRAGE